MTIQYQYFTPIQEGMPKNCSKDVSLVIDYMDNVFNRGTDAEKLALKTKFGLESLEHNDDVMGYVLQRLHWIEILSDIYQCS